MIHIVHLQSFGKFTSKEFGLSKTSLFLGKNESGKTTLFDAIFKALCGPRGSTSEGKRLNSRYGDSVEVDIKADGGDAPEVSTKDFFGIHAVRSGDIKFGAESADGAWVRNLKGRIFTAGVDLESIAEALEKLGRDDQRLSQNRELAELAEELEVKSQELEEKRAERQRILGGEGEVGKLKEEIEEIDKKIKEKEERLKEMEGRLAAQKKSLERANLERSRKLIDEYLRMTKELSGLGPFSKDRSQELSGLQNAVSDCEKDLVRLKGRCDELKKRQEAAVSGCAGLEKEQIKCKPGSEYADRLRARVVGFCDERPMVQRMSWRPITLVLAAVFLIAGIAGPFAFEQTIGLVVAAAGAVLAVVLVFASRRTERVEDREAESRLVSEVRDEWNQRRGEISRLDAETTRGLLSFFDEIRHGFEGIERRLQEMKAGRIDSEKVLGDIGREMKEIESLLEEKKKGVQKWLSDLGVKSREEYIQKRGRCEELSKAVEGKKKDLEDDCGGLGPEEALREVDRKLSAFDEQGVESKDASDSEVKKLDGEVRSLRDNLKAFRDAKAEKEKASGESSGEIRGELKGLPEEILKLEEEQRRLEARIESMENDKQAARIAAGLFEELSRDTDRQMDEIAEGMKEYLRIVTGVEREARIGDLDEDELAAEDAGGEVRSAGLLSGSTRDAIVLAARLALAQRVDGAEKLLILDEPFLTLDPERELKALEMVRAFQEKSGFQLIFFTKEPRVREKVEAIFDEVTVHDLDALA